MLLEALSREIHGRDAPGRPGGLVSPPEEQDAGSRRVSRGSQRPRLGAWAGRGGRGPGAIGGRDLGDAGGRDPEAAP